MNQKLLKQPAFPCVKRETINITTSAVRLPS